METTFLLEDAAKSQLSDDLVPQIVSTDGVTYRVVVAQSEAESASEGANILVGGGDISFSNGDLSAGSAPIYVMMNEPTELSATQSRIIVPAKPDQGPRITKTARDEKRRATHNEVERRRRDKINLWIEKLGRIIPDCQNAEMSAAAATKTHTLQSKGGILSKACNYIAELKKKADEGEALAKQVQILQNELSELRNKFEISTQENIVFREALVQAGLHINVMRSDIKTEDSILGGADPPSAFDQCQLDD